MFLFILVVVWHHLVATDGTLLSLYVGYSINDVQLNRVDILDEVSHEGHSLSHVGHLSFFLVGLLCLLN